MLSSLQSCRVDPDSSAPMYIQIRDSLAGLIRDGRLSPGSRLSTVRQVAEEFGVGTRTAARAFELLRQQGMISTRRGDGAFVAPAAAKTARTEIYLCLNRGFLRGNHRLAFDRLQGVMHAARGRGARLHPIVDASEFRPATLRDGRYGILMFDRNYRSDGFGDIAEHALSSGAPCCVVTGDSDELPHFSDSRDKGFEQATEYLVELGHRRIAMINVPPETPSGERLPVHEQNREGFLRALRRRNVTFRPELYVESQPPEDAPASHTQSALARLMSRPHRPTAIVCNNDVRALLVMDLLKAYGLRAPADMSVVGYDNRPECDKYEPPLTSVDTRRVEQGEAAIDYVLDLIQGRKSSLPTFLPRLVIRESAAPPTGGVERP